MSMWIILRWKRPVSGRLSAGASINAAGLSSTVGENANILRHCTPPHKVRQRRIRSQFVQWKCDVPYSWGHGLLAVDKLDANPVRENDEVCVYCVDSQQVQRSAHRR